MRRRSFVLGSLAILPMAARARAANANNDWSEDIDLLQDAFLQLHPGLYRYRSRSQVRRGFEALKSDFQRMPSLGAAYLTLSEFLAKFRCGHTYANFYNQRRSVAESLFAGRTRLPFHFRWLEGRLIVTRSFAGATSIESGTEIVSINGASSSDLLRDLMRYARADGHNDHKRRALLSVRGNESIETFDVFQGLIRPPTDGVHRLAMREPGAPRTTTVDVPAIDLAERRAQRESRGDKSQAAWKVDWPREDVARLIMPTWALYDSKWDWRTFLEQTFQQLTDRRTAHLILDLRGNEGGQEDCGSELLSHLISKPLALDAMEQRVRYRKVPDHLNPFLETWDDSFRDWGDAASPLGDGYYTLTRENDTGSPRQLEPRDARFAGKVSVLVDSENSSATFSFAQAIQLNELGRLIGEPTGGNKRGINGGAYFFLRLPKSGLEVDLPLIGYFPKRRQPDEGLTPDEIVVPTIDSIRSGEDVALRAALG